MYALRVLHLSIRRNSDGVIRLDKEAVEIFAQPPSAAPFKLFTLGLMIANKHLDDNTFLNKTWNEVTGISLFELNRAERWYLEKCSFEISVPNSSWLKFLDKLHSRTEQRINSFNNSSKRVCISSNQSNSRRNETYIAPHAGSEEAYKRFLIGIEDAMQSLGYGPTFSLSRSTSESPGSDSLPHNKSYIETQKLRSNLSNLHQHCHSAPLLGLSNDDDGNEEKIEEVNNEIDIFEDENGPYRPRSNNNNYIRHNY